MSLARPASFMPRASRYSACSSAGRLATSFSNLILRRISLSPQALAVSSLLMTKSIGLAVSRLRSLSANLSSSLSSMRRTGFSADN